jgi:hypothetical protein
MSYDVQLFSRQTREREQKNNDENFFDNEENLVPFTKHEHEVLTSRLFNCDYALKTENQIGKVFAHTEFSISVLLTDRGLYFTASWNEESIFEAGMTASEFTDTGEFVKYDPQQGGWEDI